MLQAAIQHANESTDTSHFLEHVMVANSLAAAAATATRALTLAEVRELQSNGCRSENWSRVRLLEPSTFSPERIVNCSFGGNVTFGTFNASVGVGPRFSCFFDGCLVVGA